MTSGRRLGNEVAEQNGGYACGLGMSLQGFRARRVRAGRVGVASVVEGACLSSRGCWVRCWSGGLAAGLVVTLWLTNFLSSLLYGVKATDPWTLGGASLLLLIVALLATYIPALRASKADPIAALKYE